MMKKRLEHTVTLTTEKFTHVLAFALAHGMQGPEGLVYLASFLKLAWDEDEVAERASQLEDELFPNREAEREEEARTRAQGVLWREWKRACPHPTHLKKRPTWWKNCLKRWSWCYCFDLQHAIGVLGEEGAYQVIAQEGQLEEQLAYMRQAVEKSREYVASIKTKDARDLWGRQIASVERFIAWLETGGYREEWLAELLQGVDLSGLDEAA